MGRVSTGLRERLTDRQLSVFDGLIQGHEVSEIAEHLGWNLRTVKFHTASILDRLNLANRYELIVAEGRIRAHRPRGPQFSILLTDRQRQVYRMIVRARPLEEIEEKLGLTSRTLKFHIREILRRTQRPTRARLTADHWGLRSPLASGRPPSPAELLMIRVLQQNLERLETNRAHIEERIRELEASLPS